MFSADKFPLEPALWFDTATPEPITQALAESLSTDIVIIGAGYAGLSTALHLAELGHAPVVLDAKQIGFGVSGRNGGQLVPGLKWDPDALIKQFGPEDGQRVVDFAGSTTQTVFELIDRHGLNVPNARNGWIQPAHSAAGMALAESRCAQWLKHGADVRLLDRQETQELIGAANYHGGWLDRRGGAVQPLSYVRELARVAQERGVAIYTQTPVMYIDRRADGWEVTTNAGPAIKTRKLIVCANAYSDGLWPGLKQSIIDANTYQAATETLPADVQASIFPQGHVASDTRKLLLYFRKDHTGRFIMGGRGPFREPKSQDDWAHLKRATARMFPQLAKVKWDYHWCGRVAVTPDFYPHLHEPAPDLFIEIGCQGRGVGLQTAMGKAIANYVHTGDRDALPLPVSQIKPMPLYGLRKLYVSAVVTWYRMNDIGR